MLADEDNSADDAFLIDRATDRRLDSPSQIHSPPPKSARTLASRSYRGKADNGSGECDQATAKLVPQPQPATAFGFLIWKLWPIRSST